eukprot:4662739-Amphidinium_carterae.1
MAEQGGCSSYRQQSVSKTVGILYMKDDFSVTYLMASLKSNPLRVVRILLGMPAAKSSLVRASSSPVPVVVSNAES